eukprot:Partr_v1_DN26433_c0_g1_i2_m23900 putative Sphingomyelin phosphodiesterase 2, neutral membrane (Neutral sphingomyelinase)
MDFHIITLINQLNSSMELRTLSLNIWGVPLVAKNRKQRIEAIAEYLQQSQLDIIGMQEIWIKEDYLHFTSALVQRFPYTYYFRSGVIGSGLAVFSRFPIVEVSMKRYSLNGRPQRIQHGDWLGGKSVGLSRIRLPTGQLVDFYNTHLHARYVVDQMDSGKDEYLAHRLAQVWELGQFVRHTRRNLVVVVGDLNFSDDNVGYQLLTLDDRFGGVAMVDCFVSTTADPVKLERMEAELKAAGVEVGSAQWVDALEGITSQAPSNSYSPPSGRSDFTERIDYTFFYPCAGFELICARCALLKRVPGAKFSYSDHYGILSLFQVADTAVGSPESVPVVVRNIPSMTDVNLSPVQVASPTQDNNLWQLQPIDVPDDRVIYETIKILTWGVNDSISRHKWHGVGLVVLVILEIALIVLAFVIGKLGGLSTLVSGVMGVLICYEVATTRFIIPEELSALERVRSEVLVYVRGHVHNLHPSIPGAIVSLLSNARGAVDSRRNSLLDPGPSGLIRSESAVLLSGLSNAITGSQDHPPSQLL